jgi:hypothetical protein
MFKTRKGNGKTKNAQKIIKTVTISGSASTMPIYYEGQLE